MIIERLKVNKVDLPKFICAFVLLNALPPSYSNIVVLCLQTTATDKLDFKTIQNAVQLEFEHKHPIVANRLTAVKRKGPDPAFQQQRNQQPARPSGSGSGALQDSSNQNNKGKGKLR